MRILTLLAVAASATLASGPAAPHAAASAAGSPRLSADTRQLPAAGSRVGLASRQEDPTREVLAAAAAIVAAFGRHDPDAYFALFDPEATFIFHTTPDRLENRAAYRREWATWEKELGFRVRSCTSSDQRVQLHGDVAIFTHSVRTELTTREGESTLDERETIVFQRRGGQWVAVHEHLSPHGDPGGAQ